MVSFVCLFFFNRDFVGGLLDVVSMKRFRFVETDQELVLFFLLLFYPTKMVILEPSHCLPDPPPRSHLKPRLYLSCTVFIEVKMLTWRTCNLFISCKHPPWIALGRAEVSGRSVEYINMYLCVANSLFFLCIEVISLWWDVVSHREKVAGLGNCGAACLLCLEHTFVLSLFFLLSVIISIIPPVLTVFDQYSHTHTHITKWRKTTAVNMNHKLLGWMYN